MNEVKIIANYLPQFHSIPENDEWWGKGYTDWTAVKNSKSLFKGHIQPHRPLENNYYDLSKVENIRWQVELANTYGIYGFAIYHYWFNSEQKLLEKPGELLLENKDINIHFCFIWDNSTWKRTWSNVKFGNDWGEDDKKTRQSNVSNGILAELKYGNEEDWKLHFEYLLQFFKDDRYIKINNKPVFGIFNQDNEQDILKKMFSYWNELAQKNGFEGLYILGKRNHHGIKVTEYLYDYEPLKHGWLYDDFAGKVYQKIRTNLYRKLKVVDKYDYDKIWKKIINSAKNNQDTNLFYGAFVSYDDTPRRGARGKAIIGGTPDKFEKYMAELIGVSKKQGKEYLFLTAWNEWGEGAYLEPDTENGYAYLEALKRAVESVDAENA